MVQPLGHQKNKKNKKRAWKLKGKSGLSNESLSLMQALKSLQSTMGFFLVQDAEAKQIEEDAKTLKMLVETTCFSGSFLALFTEIEDKGLLRKECIKLKALCLKAGVKLHKAISDRVELAIKMDL